MDSKRKSYSALEKLTMVKYAEVHGNRSTGRHFSGISEACIRRWRQQKERLQQLPSTKKAERGSLSVYPELEMKLLDWVVGERQQGVVVSCMEIQQKAKLLAISDPSAAPFKGSRGWADRFIERHGLSVRRQRGATIVQRRPADHEQKVEALQNADQTPLTLDILCNLAVESKRQKTVSICITVGTQNILPNY